jgi:putative peptide zinc metalloprotease protein
MTAARRTTTSVPLVSAAAAPEEGTKALAERHGPASDRPSLAAHLVIRRVVRMGEVTWVVKNPEKDAYYTFSDPEWGIIELFDGQRTTAEIAEEYNRLFPNANVDIQFALEYEEMLRNTDLLQRSVAEKSLLLLSRFRTERQRAAEEKAEGFNPFFMKFHVFDPDRFLNRTVKYVRWIWTPPLVVIWALAVAWTIGVFVLHWAPIWAGTYELYAFLHKPLIDVLQFFCILCIIGGIHELGHAYATKVYGGDVHDIGLALLYFTPAFYCDTTDAILFQNKWHRLWTTTAGIYVEGFICAGATALWVASYPDTLLNELAYKTMLFTGVSTIFFNINPLIKIDGYYALTSLLEMPELREESFRYLGAQFQSRILRLPVERPAVSRRKRRIYWIYGVLALAYTTVIMRFIGGLFYNFYSKYFPNVAVVLLLLTLYRVFRKRVRLVTRTGRLFYLDKKEFLMSARSRRPLAIAGAVLVVALFIPFTRRTISTEAVLRPAGVARIEAPEAGIVSEVLVNEGDGVTKGAELFRVANDAAQADTAHYAAESRRLTYAASRARDAQIASDAGDAERRGAAAREGMTSGLAREERLVLKSPIGGTVLTSDVGDLVGRYVPSGALLAEVGDCRRLVAELPVSERLLDLLETGSPVRALVRQHPLAPIHGTVARISPATLEQPSTVGGLSEPLAPSDRPGQFVALAVFDNADGRLRPGSVIRAKVYGRRASYAGRAWRVVSRWLQTLVW